MDGFDAKVALDEFLRQRSEGIFFPPEWEDSMSIDEAYQVQLALLDRLTSHGKRQIGWKVGLTAKPIQAQFNVHEPGFGFLLDDAPYQSGASISFESLISPGFENELCMAMGAALAGPDVTPDKARAAIATVAPAFELIETRGDSRNSLAKGIPDNLQQKGFITGAPMPLRDAPDLSQVIVRITVNGEEVDEGRGDAVLGDPVNSVVWLANKLAEFGRSLRPGDLIMTGSFTKQHRVEKGHVISAAFEGIGSVGASFP